MYDNKKLDKLQQEYEQWEEVHVGDQCHAICGCDARVTDHFYGHGPYDDRGRGGRSSSDDGKECEDQ